MKSLSQLFLENVIDNLYQDLDKIFTQEDFISICSQRYNKEISLLLLVGFLKKNTFLSTMYLLPSDIGISSYLYLTLNFIEKHLDIPWNWDYILFKSPIIMDIIEKYPQPPSYLPLKFSLLILNWYLLSRNPHLTMEFVEKHFDKPWDWQGLSNMSNLNIEFIEKHIDKDWNWNVLSLNPNVTIKFIENHPELPWSYYWLSRSPNLTMSFVEQHLDESWDWGYEGLSSNPNLTMEFLEQHLDEDWDWYSLYKHPNLTIDFIEKELFSSRFNSLNLRRYFYKLILLSLNPNLTMEFIERHVNENLDWEILSGNPHLTMDFIEKHIEKNWGWHRLSSNPNLTMEFIEKHLDQPWSGYWLSSNPNLTIEFVLKYPGMGWNWIKIFERFKMCYLNLFSSRENDVGVEINRNILLLSQKDEGYTHKELERFLIKLGLSSLGSRSELIERLMVYSK